MYIETTTVNIVMHHIILMIYTQFNNILSPVEPEVIHISHMQFIYQTDLVNLV
jgi:hypothetical protein